MSYDSALEAVHARGHIDDKTMAYLTPKDPKPGRFYLLPKIHNESNPGMCEGRFSTNGRRRKSINSDIFSVG
jgi:hypothetical protein